MTVKCLLVTQLDSNGKPTGGGTLFDFGRVPCVGELIYFPNTDVSITRWEVKRVIHVDHDVEEKSNVAVHAILWAETSSDPVFDIVPEEYQ